MVGFNDDIVALTNSHEELAADHGCDRDEIGSDDGKVVANERDGKGVVHAGVDETQQVLLSRSKNQAVVRTTRSGRVNALSTEGDGAAVRWRTVLNQLSNIVKTIRGLAVVVLDHVWSQVNVIVGRSRAIDDECSYHSVAVLVGVVAMVPVDRLVGCSVFVEGYWLTKRCRIV